jgi:hypothetical protein
MSADNFIIAIVDETGKITSYAGEYSNFAKPVPIVFDIRKADVYLSSTTAEVYARRIKHGNPLLNLKVFKVRVKTTKHVEIIN